MSKLKDIILGDFDNLLLREKYLTTIPIVAFIGTVPAVFLNLFFNSTELSLFTVATSIVFAIGYLLIRFFKFYRLSGWCVFLNAMSLGAASWMLFEGSRGSAVPIVMILLIYCFLIFEKFERYLAVFLALLQLAILMYIEFKFPHLIQKYDTNLDRLIDIYVTYLLCAFVIVYFLLTLLKFYNIEREKAIRANSLKTIFLSNMSHEIRTPLNGIIGFASILKEGIAIKAMEQKYLDVISDSGNQLLNLVNDIIDLSKIESNQLVFKNNTINVVSLMRTAIEFHISSNLYKSDAVELRLQIPKDQNTITIYADSVRLLQIINNLINNALKNTKQGFVELGIVNQTERNPKEITFYVKDTGKGIPEEMKKHIFYRHVQLDGKDYIDHSAGLGLSIVSALLKGMNGKIWLESELEQGATFYFTIPVGTTETKH